METAHADKLALMENSEIAAAFFIEAAEASFDEPFGVGNLFGFLYPREPRAEMFFVCQDKCKELPGIVRSKKAETGILVYSRAKRRGFDFIFH